MVMAKILVADKDDVYRRIYEKNLKTNGHRLIMTGNYDIAPDLVDIHAPDVVVFDISKSLESGLQAIQQIAGSKRDTPIILHSNCNDFSCNFRTWCADAFVRKTEDLDDLKKEINNRIKQRVRAS